MIVGSKEKNLPDLMWCYITPENAEVLISNTPLPYRKVQEQRVRAYAAEMKAGRWEKTCGVIGLEKSSGPVTNGMHRLTACVKSKTSFLSIVAIGVRHTVGEDRVMARTLYQELAFRGEQYGRVLAPALVSLDDWKNGRLGNETTGGPVASVINQLSLLDEYPTIRESSRRASELRGKFGHLPFIAMLHCLGSIKSPEVANWFLDRLIDGHDLTRNDPVLLLRERMVSDHYSRTRMLRPEWQALHILAWNHTLNGTSPPRLMWRGTGPGKQAFPKILLSAE